MNRYVSNPYRTEILLVQGSERDKHSILYGRIEVGSARSRLWR